MHQLPHELLFYRPNWGQLEMQKGQKIKKNMQKVGVGCDGLLDVDAQQLHCLFSLLFSSFTLLLFFSILYGLTSLLFFKTLLLFYSLKSLFLDCPMFPFKVSVLRLTDKQQQPHLKTAFP
jgi:hypothetical protein